MAILTELDSDSQAAQNITTEQSYNAYTVTDDRVECVVRLQLTGIAGNNDYKVRVTVDGGTEYEVYSDTVPVDNGITDRIFASRKFIALKDEVIDVKITGPAGDTSIAVLSKIFGREM